MKKCSSIKQTLTTIFHAPLIKQTSFHNILSDHWPARDLEILWGILRNRSPSVPFQGPLGGLKTETQIAPKYLSPFNEVFNRPNYINWLKLILQNEPGFTR